MKATYSEKYYRESYDELFRKYGKHCNYEQQLSWFLSDYDFEAVPEAAREASIAMITKLCAERIAKEAREELMAKMQRVKDVRDGKASLGYSDRVQALKAWEDLHMSFEFSCYVLSQFKKKYQI